MESVAVPSRASRRRRAGLVATALTAGLLTAPAGPLDLALSPAVAPASAAPVPATPSGLPPAIEPLPAYEPQVGCVVESEGARRFSRLVLSTYPGTGSGGIVRDCAVGGSSEHKEGRAWDWNVSAASQSAYADALIDWLFASDEHGNSYAMARRLGIMYIVWDRQIWSAEQASAGWRPYSGRDPHTLHMHFSFSRAGGAAETSFWTGSVGGSAGASSTPRLELGDSGPAVETLQERLGIPADGSFGPATASAVSEFQREHDLTADGVVGGATWRALAPPSTSSSTSSDGSTPGATLRAGSSGAGVEALQRLLGIEADGRFGPGTHAALVDAQRERGLTADGVAGPATWAALQSGAGGAAESGATVRLGDNGPAVEELQRLLGRPRTPRCAPPRAPGG